MGFFIEGEVTWLDHALASARVGFAFLLAQLGHNLVDGDVHRGVILGLAADDQRCPRLVNQNRIHLVDDGEMQAALYAVCHFVNHVVAQVVKTVLVVGTVSDVALISRLLFFTRHGGQIDPHRHA